MWKKVLKVFVKVLIGVVAVLVLGIAAFFAYYQWYSQISKGPRIPNYTNPKTALLVVDIQEDYTGPGARMPYSDGARIVEATNKLLSRDYLNVYIQNVITDPVAKLVMPGLNEQGSPGIEMDKRLLRTPNVRTIQKYRPDAFTNPELDKYLGSQSVNHVIIVGLDGAGCVDATLKGALNRGYKVTAAMEGIATESGKPLAELSAEWQTLGVSVVDLP